MRTSPYIIPKSNSSYHCGSSSFSLLRTLLYSATACSLVLSPYVYANTTPVVNQQSSAKQELERIQKETIQKQLAEKKYQQPQQNLNANKQSSYDSTCLNYDGVEVIGVTLIDLKRITPVPQDCISKKTINAFNRALTKAYLAQGYISMSIELKTHKSIVNNTPSGKNSSVPVPQERKKLIITVFEGKVARINNKTTLVSAKTLLPNILGKPLNIKDLDQGVDNANRLLKSKVVVDVFPNKDGTVDVELTKQQQRARLGYPSNNKKDTNPNLDNEQQTTFSDKLSGSFTIDNQGSESVGKVMGRFAVTVDSPLNLADSLTISGSHPIRTLDNYRNNSRSLALNYSIPFGYLRAGLYGSYSDYSNIITLKKTGNYEQEGKSTQLGLSSDYTFSRGSNHVAKLTANLEQFDTESYFAQSQLQNQTYDVTSLKIGADLLSIQPQGFYSLNGSVETDIDMSDNQSSYVLWGLDTSTTGYHAQLLNSKLRWRNSHSLNVRYSDDVLPVIKQSSLLSNNMVRGFGTLSSSAEQAIALQSTVYLSNNVKDWQINPYIGLDIGMQKENLSATKSSAIGGVLGLTASKTNTVNQSDYKMSLEYGKGVLKKPVNKNHIKQKDDNLLLKIKWNY